MGAIFPSFEHMRNTLPESADITTNELIGFVIYIIVFIPLLFIHPSKLQPFLTFSFAAVAATIVGMFVWAVGSNGGAGELISPNKSISTR